MEKVDQVEMNGMAGWTDFQRQQHLSMMERRFRTVRSTSNVVVALGALWIVFGIVVQEPVVVGLASLAIIGSTAAAILIRSERKLLARLIWFSTGLMAVMGAVFSLPATSNVELMFAVLLGGPFMTFSMRREKPLILLLLGVILGSWLLFRFLGPGLFGPPILEAGQLEPYLSGGVLATIFTIIIVEMMAFGQLADSYSEDLLHAHQEESRANRAKSEFLAAMSHEIRTPMNGVLGMAEVLENTDLTPEQRRILSTIRDSSTALLWIIDDILDVSRIEAGKMELVQAPMRLVPLIEGAMATLRPHAGQMQVELSLSLQVDLPDTMMGDAGRLRQILINLLGNGIKFSEPSAISEIGHRPGKVGLRVEMREPGWIDFLVQDNGIGIDPEVQEAIFAPFERSSVVAKSMIKGNGLGLTIVRQLVSQMGGEVSVESAPEEGSLFTVRLPINAPSGPIKAPRLAGVKVVAMMPETEASCSWPAYVLAADCDLKWVRDREEFLALARLSGEDTVFILPEREPGNHRDGWFQGRLENELPDLRLLELSSKAGSVPEPRNNRRTMVQVGPVLPSEFWEALARVAGRSKHSGLQLDPVGAALPKRPTGVHILVAEDNEINRAVVKDQLALLGCEVTLVRNGADCLAAWKQGDFDLILTDCQMPVMDGFELTRIIREIEEQQRLKHTPIVAVTANALAGEAETCMSEGMDAYVSKPVTIAGLETVIRQQLPTMQAHSQALGQAGNRAALPRG